MRVAPARDPAAAGGLPAGGLAAGRCSRAGAEAGRVAPFTAAAADDTRATALEEGARSERVFAASALVPRTDAAVSVAFGVLAGIGLATLLFFGTAAGADGAGFAAVVRRLLEAGEDEVFTFAGFELRVGGVEDVEGRGARLEEIRDVLLLSPARAVTFFREALRSALRTAAFFLPTLAVFFFSVGLGTATSRKNST